MEILNNMIYGGDPGTGHDSGQEFYPPGATISEPVPDGFQLINNPRSVIASGPEGAMIQLNLDSKPYKGDMDNYLQMWTGKTRLLSVERITVNGMNGATEQFRSAGEMASLTYALLPFSNTADEFFASCFLLPEADKTARNGLQRTTFSLHTISAWEAAATRPWRLKIRPVQAGDTVARLSRQMAVNNFKEETFRVLNG